MTKTNNIANNKNDNNADKPLKNVTDAVKDSTELKDIESSLRNKFRKSIFTNFAKAIRQYELLQPNDKVAVCISGGKDSMLMAKLFQELQRHNKFEFELVFLVMNPGYNTKNLELIIENSAKLGIPITMFETDIFEDILSVKRSPCYVCARMRRGYLYNKAKELGCNKIALGHHFDDAIETILMGMLNSGQFQTMMPKLHSKNHPNMELIRPMYLIREDDIKHWCKYNNLNFIQCACRFTEQENLSDNKMKSARSHTKELIKKLKHEIPQIEDNIFKSVEGVNLSTIISYKDSNGKIHDFLENYNSKKKL